jgi:hypothetical protein
MSLLIRKVWVIMCALSFVSCNTSPTPLTGTPPVKALKIKAFTHGDGFFIKKFYFPADIYTPVMEDKKSYYYAPGGGRAKVYDTGMTYAQTAGIYIDKSSTVPDGIYIKGYGNFYGKLRKREIPATIIK